MQSDGTVYTGDFVFGEITGTGNYTYASGVTYAGGVKNGMYDGFGVYSEAETLYRYEGNFEKNYYSGQGILYDDQITYKGTFFEDMKQGWGSYEEVNGVSFVGTFKEDQFSFGVQRSDNGDLYTGQFNEDSEFEGAGILISQEEGVFEGMFEGGEYMGGTSQDSKTRKNSTNVFLTHAATRPKFFNSLKTFKDFNV